MNSYICPDCSGDFSHAVALLGPEAFELHRQSHNREQIQAKVDEVKRLLEQKDFDALDRAFKLMHEIIDNF
jgi:hypothetical protein